MEEETQLPEETARSPEVDPRSSIGFSPARLLSLLDLRKLTRAQTVNIAFDIMASAFTFACLLYDYDPPWVKILLPFFTLCLMVWYLKKII